MQKRGLKQPLSEASLALILTLALPMNAVSSEPLPQWELGAGVAVLEAPDYRGADEGQVYALPLPYVIYRGDVLQIDRQRIQGLLAESERMELVVSLNASTPVDSDDNKARAGMEDLDPTLEVGPSLNFFLGSKEKNPVITLRLPVRAVFAVDTDSSSVDNIGWIAQPNLNINWSNIGTGNNWNYGIVAGPLFATRKYHEYFYTVDPADATARRPDYSAPSGYSGFQLTGTMSRRFSNYWMGAFLRYDNLEGVAFDDSPLLKKHDNITLGFGIAYIFARSDVLVDAQP